MPTAKKLPSGSWRCQVFSHNEPKFDASGKPIIDEKTGKPKQKRVYESFTSQDPSKRGKVEVELAASKFAATRGYSSTNKVKELGVWDAVDAYCKLKNNVLSVSTIRGYKQLRVCFEPISTIPLKRLTQMDVQIWINTLSADRSPKTVRNAHGLLSAVLNLYYPESTLHTTLPKPKTPNLYTPTDGDLKVLIKYLRTHDRDLLVSVYLAAFGTLRRSEICALDSIDAEGNIIHITKGMVIDENRNWIIKAPKTQTSIRDVQLPDFIIELFPERGRVVDLNPAQVSNRFVRALAKLDIPKFRFHDLRHYSASILHVIGMPDQYIMARGGWKTDSVMKRVYRGTMSDYEKKFTEKALKHFDDMQHDCNTK